MSDISKTGGESSEKCFLSVDETKVIDFSSSCAHCNVSYHNKVLEEGDKDDDGMGLDVLFNESKPHITDNNMVVTVIDITDDEVTDDQNHALSDVKKTEVEHICNVVIPPAFSSRNSEKYIDFDAATRELEEILSSIINMQFMQEGDLQETSLEHQQDGNNEEEDFGDAVIRFFDVNIDDSEEYSNEIRKVATSAEEKYVLWLPGDVFVGDLHHCTICYGTLEMSDIIFCQQCDQCICFSCLKMHITTDIYQSKIVIECPGSTDCNKKLSDQLVSAFVPARVMGIFVKNKVEAEKNPNIKTCPGCHKVEHKTEKQKSIPIKCTACDTTWCFFCHAPWHSGIACSDYQRDIEGAGTKALKYWAKSKVNGSKNAKKCPKCNHYIERINGCDHMTCSKCNTDFCYSCGGKHYSLGWLGDHHSTYSFLGCKYNLYPNKPILRMKRNFEDENETDEDDDADDDDDDDDDGLFSYKNKKTLTFSTTESLKMIADTKNKTHNDVSKKRKVIDSDDDDSSDTDSETGSSDGDESDDEDSEDEKDDVIVVVKELDSIIDDLGPPSPPPPPPPPQYDITLAARPTLNNDVLNRLRQASKLNQTINSSPDTRSLDTSDVNMSADVFNPTIALEDEMISLKVRTHGIIARYFVNKGAPLEQLFGMIAANEDKAPSRLLLSYKNQTIRPTDTVTSLSLTIATVIECLVVDDDVIDSDDDNKMTLKIQHEGKRTRTEYRVNKNHTLEKHVRTFCEKNELPYHKCVLLFDGEEISATGKLSTLDIEDGDVIDIIIKQ